MTELRQTDSLNPDFLILEKELDEGLYDLYGPSQADYDQYNKCGHLRDVLIVYEDNVPVGCGALRPYDETCSEIKRIYVRPAYRGKGYARRIMLGLERLAIEKGYTRAILQTGAEQIAAVRLYESLGYREIENYPPYVGDEGSLCMGKMLRP